MTRRLLWTSTAVGLAGWALPGCPGSQPAPTNTNDNTPAGPVALDADGVGFPTSGDALIVIDERGTAAVGSAIYYGVDDGTTVRPTALIADTGEDVLVVQFDTSGLPETAVLGAFNLAFLQGGNGTIDIELRDGDTLVTTVTGVDVSGTSGSARSASQLFSVDDLTLCVPTLVSSLGFTRNNGTLSGDQLSCLESWGSITNGARAHCLYEEALAARLEEVRIGCPQQEDPAACERRTRTWLNSTNAAIIYFEAFADRRIAAALSGFPPCAPDNTFNPDNSTDDTDADADGVVDRRDACKVTPAGEAVNAFGCSLSQLGAIRCTDYVTDATDCRADGCCNPDCLIDPDCTNAILCERGQRCCTGDGVCDPGCPVEEAQCAFCIADGTCIQGCFPTPDPDCDAVANDNIANDNASAGNDNTTGNDNTPVLTGDPCIDTPTNWRASVVGPGTVCFGEPQDLEIDSGAFSGEVPHINFPVEVRFEFTEFALDDFGVDASAAVLDGTVVLLDASDLETLAEPDDVLRRAGVLRCLDQHPGDDEFIVRYDTTVIDGCGVTLYERSFSFSCCAPTGTLICGDTCSE